LPKVLISDNATITNDLEKTTISVSLKNTEKQLALMIRLKVLQSESGKRVLPIFYSDNYISLVPGESRTISIEFKNKNLEGEKPKLMVEGWNIIPLEIKMN
jgi:beta-mannosidase